MTLEELANIDWDEVAVKMNGDVYRCDEGEDLDLDDVENAIAEVDEIRSRLTIIRAMIQAAKGVTGG